MVTCGRLEMMLNRTNRIRLEVNRVEGDFYEVFLTSHHRYTRVYRQVFTEDQAGRVVCGPREQHLMAMDPSGRVFRIQSALGKSLGMLTLWQDHLGDQWRVWETDDSAVAEAANPLPMVFSESRV